MTSNVISWRDVIKGRYLKMNEIESSQAESVMTDAADDDQYSSIKEDDYISGSEELMGNEFRGNFILDSYPYPGTNQTIVCQVIPSQRVIH